MDLLEMMKARHSVRQYKRVKIEPEKKELLTSLIRECNQESGLNIQILFDEPKCFDSMMAHYGKFSGVENYIALVGRKESNLGEKKAIWKKKQATMVRSLC